MGRTVGKMASGVSNLVHLNEIYVVKHLADLAVYIDSGTIGSDNRNSVKIVFAFGRRSHEHERLVKLVFQSN